MALCFMFSFVLQVMSLNLGSTQVELTLGRLANAIKKANATNGNRQKAEVGHGLRDGSREK